MSLFTSVIVNTAGSGPKRPIKPTQLYEPHLGGTKQRARTPEEERVWRHRVMKRYARMMNPETKDPDA